MTSATSKRSLRSAEIESMTSWLDSRLPGTGEVTISPLEQSAGNSHATYLLQRGLRKWVARVAPQRRGDDDTGGYDLSREYRVLDALRGTAIPHPDVVACGADDDCPIDRDLLVSEFVDGHTLVGSLPTALATPDNALAVTKSIVHTLALVHDFDWRASTLVTMTPSGDFLTRQLEKGEQILARYQRRPLPALEKLLVSLRENQTTTARLGLIHGDYSPSNIMIPNNGAAKVLSVLDWETATIGDTMVDIGYLTARWVHPGEDELLATLALGGAHAADHACLPSRQVLGEIYAEATGCDVSDLPYYQGLGMARIAAAVEVRVGRAIDAENQDAAAMFGAISDRCAEHGLRMMDGR